MTRTRFASPDARTTPLDDIRVAVSAVIFALRPSEPGQTIVLPVVRRTREPYDGFWALPGGWLRADEDLDAAASRTLAETTGLAPSYLEQLYAFGAIDRSPSRVVSVVYWALLRGDEVDAQIAAHDQDGTAPENVEWFDAAALPPLAFDHDQIVDYAMWRLRNKVGYSRIAHGFLPEEFTLADLREAYEAILGRQLDPANFRRQVEGSHSLVRTDSFRTGSHRPARLYRHNHDVELADRGPLAVGTRTRATGDPGSAPRLADSSRNE